MPQPRGAPTPVRRAERLAAVTLVAYVAGGAAQLLTNPSARPGTGSLLALAVLAALAWVAWPAREARRAPGARWVLAPAAAGPAAATLGGGTELIDPRA
ncbi:MAG: hypothetical protein ACT4RN_11035, partial [Pseudonocardia sp.]